jgi:hypothetical protein
MLCTKKGRVDQEYIVAVGSTVTDLGDSMADGGYDFKRIRGQCYTMSY